MDRVESFEWSLSFLTTFLLFPPLSAFLGLRGVFLAPLRLDFATTGLFGAFLALLVDCLPLAGVEIGAARGAFCCLSVMLVGAAVVSTVVLLGAEEVFRRPERVLIISWV